MHKASGIKRHIGVDTQGLPHFIEITSQSLKTNIQLIYKKRTNTRCKKPFATAVREHWVVENPLNWRLGVIFGDDSSRINGNAATIMTRICHLCMNLFQQASSSLSLVKKKRKAAWGDAYRTKVMFSSAF